MKNRTHTLQIHRDKREFLNYIGIVAILVALLVWQLVPRSVLPLKVDVSYVENEAVFIAMSPAETNENWYLHPESYTKPLEKYPELHTEFYKDNEIYHTSYRVVLRLPVILTSRERGSIGPMVSSSGYLHDDDGRYLGYGRYVMFGDHYNSYIDGEMTYGQTIRTLEYFDFSPDEFEQASYVSLSSNAFVVENELDIREGEGPTIIIEITADVKSRIKAEGERIMEAFEPPEPIAFSADEYAEWEFDAIIINAYMWVDNIIRNSDSFGRYPHSYWYRDSYGYFSGSGERQTDGDSIVTKGYVILENKEYQYEMTISIDSWRVTRLVIGDVALV